MLVIRGRDLVRAVTDNPFHELVHTHGHMAGMSEVVKGIGVMVPVGNLTNVLAELLGHIRTQFNGPVLLHGGQGHLHAVFFGKGESLDQLIQANSAGIVTVGYTRGTGGSSSNRPVLRDLQMLSEEKGGNV